MPRKLTTAIIGFVAVLLLLLLAGPAVVDWSGTKREIAARLELALGRRVEIAGPLRVRLLPAPTVTVEGLSVADTPDAGPEPMAEIAALRLRLKLWPLLGGEVVVDSLTLERPRLHLRRLADGLGNWDITPGEKPQGGEAAPSQPRSPSSEPPSGSPSRRPVVRIDTVVVEDGQLTYRAGDDPPLAVEGIALRLTLQGPSGPFAAKGALNWRGVPVEIEAAFGDVAGERVTPAKLALRLPGSDTHLDFVGTVTGTDLSGRLTATAESPERLSAALGGVPVPGATVTADAVLTANPTEAALSSLVIGFGPTRVTGSVVAALTGTTRIDLALSAPTLDLDNWIRAPRPPPPPPAVSPAGGPTPAAAPMPAKIFSLPGKLFVNAELGIGALSWHGRVVQGAQVEATLDEGELVLDRAQATLPGGTQIAADGTLSAKDGKPLFEGRLQAGSDDLPVLLAWLSPEATGLPGGRFSATAAITADAAELALADLRFAVDAVEARGRAAVSLGGGAPAITLALAIDSRDHVLPLPAAVTLSAELAGRDVVVRQASARLGGGAVLLTASGRVDDPLGRRRFHLDLGAHADSVAQALRMAGAAAQPRGSSGPLAIAAKLSGEDRAIDLAELDGLAGPTHVTGALHLTLGDGKPMVTGRLAGDSIDLDAWAASERGGAPPSSAGGRKGHSAAAPPAAPIIAVAAGGGAPWSHQPLDLSPLKAFDVRLELAVQALTWQGWRVEAATARLGVEGGNASLDRLTAKLLGGDVAADARLTGGSLPQISGTLSVSGADLAKLGQSGAKLRLSQGIAAGQAKFVLVGRSPFEMAARLSGDGRFDVRNGVVEGFDLPAVNAQLKDIKNIGNVFALAQAGLGGGSTRFSALTGTAHGENGVVTTRDAKLEADGGTATAEATADLGRWTLESRVAIRVDLGKAPPVTLRFDGPLDDPRKTIDVNDLQRALVARGLGSALKGATQPDQDGKPPSTAKILQNLLKGLGGK